MPGNRLSLDAALHTFQYAQVSIGAVATGFPASLLADSIVKSDAMRVDVTLEATNGLRYTTDGVSVPTSTTGMPVPGGGSFTILGVDNIRNFKAIQSGASAATMNCEAKR